MNIVASPPDTEMPPDPELTHLLAVSRTECEHAEEALRAAVERARRSGMTWQHIALLLHTTPGAARMAHYRATTYAKAIAA